VRGSRASKAKNQILRTGTEKSSRQCAPTSSTRPWRLYVC